VIVDINNSKTHRLKNILSSVRIQLSPERIQLNTKLWRIGHFNEYKGGLLMATREVCGDYLHSLKDFSASPFKNIQEPLIRTS
jgi:hypothetical protein